MTKPTVPLTAHSYRIIFDGINTHPIECPKNQGTHKNLTEVRLAVVDYYRLKAGDCIYILSVNADYSERSAHLQLLDDYIQKIAKAACASYLDWFPENAEWCKLVTGRGLSHKPKPKNPYTEPKTPAETKINLLVRAYSNEDLIAVLMEPAKCQRVHSMVGGLYKWIKRNIVEELQRRGIRGRVREDCMALLENEAGMQQELDPTNPIMFLVESMTLLCSCDF